MLGCMACGVVRIDGDARWLMVAQPPVLAVQETAVKLFYGNARGKWLDTSTQQGRVRMHTCGCWCSPTAFDRTTSRELRGVLQACLRFACTTMPPREACSRLITPSLPPTTVLGANQRLGRWRHSSLARKMGRVGPPGAPALCSRQFRIPAFTAFRSVTTVIMEKSSVHCTQLSRLQVLRAVLWRLPVVAMPVMASSGAMSSL